MSKVVCVTGAAGQIAYALLPSLCNGSIFGEEVSLDLRLLDIEPMMGALRGVTMELEDCAYPLLSNVTATDDPLVAFRDCDVAVLVGAMPRKEGMERKDLLRANAKIFKAQGAALDQVALKTVKVLVVGNPANTNAYIVSHYAPSISKLNFTALTRLDDNRARSALAGRLSVPVDAVERSIIWGNHSNTQFPDVSHVRIRGQPRQDIIQAIGPAYYRQEFIKTIQGRGGAVIAARKLSSAMSAAKAIADHLRDWLAVRRALHTEDDDWASMAVYSTGAGYDPSDVPEDVFFSLPVRCSRDGSWTAVKGIEPWDRELLQRTAMELVAERDEALGFLKSEEGKPGQETLSPLPSCLLNRLVGSMPASKL